MMLGRRHWSYDHDMQRPATKLFRRGKVQLRGVAGAGVVTATAQFHYLRGGSA
jgi:hypothetical protein